jgi:hypothetical protein
MDSQELFEDAINNGKAVNGNRCHIDIALSGDIDLNPLKQFNIEELYFAEGNIEWFYNVPRDIKKIVINDNKLEKIPTTELRNLVSLEANNNNLTKIDLKGMDRIVSLRVNNNRITSMVNFPSSLEVLSIDQNNLENLDLKGCTSCKQVSCLNNIGLQKIYNAPVSRSDFEIIKDSHTQLELKMRKTHKMAKENVEYPNVKEAVNKYYELKNDYEEHKKKVIKDIMDKKGKSRRDKIQEARVATFKCINCKQQGGTKFWKDYDNNLRAICGNTEKPCRLDINISASLTMTEQEISLFKQDIEDAKTQIVQLKLDTLFGYITEKTSVELFDENIKKINNDEINKILNDNTYSYHDILFNPQKKNLIASKMETVYSELANIRKIMEEYSKTKNKKLLRDATVINKVIQTNINTIRAIKYPICEIVKESTYNYVDENGDLLDEKNVSKTEYNVLKQFPYSFDDYLNPNLELLEVKKYSTK